MLILFHFSYKLNGTDFTFCDELNEIELFIDFYQSKYNLLHLQLCSDNVNGVIK